MKRDSAGFIGDLHGSAWQWVRGLYAVTPETTDTAGLQRKVQAAIAGGARLVQYRNKTSHQVLREEQAGALNALCGARAVPLIVNDDIELACAIRADGVHLGKEDAPLSARLREALFDQVVRQLHEYLFRPQRSEQPALGHPEDDVVEVESEEDVGVEERGERRHQPPLPGCRFSEGTPLGSSS